MSALDANFVSAGGDAAGRGCDRQCVRGCARGDDVDRFLSLIHDVVLELGDARIRFQAVDANHDVDPTLLDDHADALVALQCELIAMLLAAVQLTRDRVRREKPRRVRLRRLDDLGTGWPGDRRCRKARAADDARKILTRTNHCETPP